MLAAYQGGAVVAASGAGATLLCDPMVDPRGGAYTVGLGVVKNLAVFPYHGTAADHLRERSIDLLPRDAVLAGVDEETALVKGPTAGRSPAPARSRSTASTARARIRRATRPTGLARLHSR